jgi:hypothetical protein
MLRTIACGLYHTFTFYALGGIIMGISQSLFGETPYDGLAVKAIAFALDVGVFFFLVRLWYRRASEERYLVGLLGMTAAYLISYFIGLPGDCP